MAATTLRSSTNSAAFEYKQVMLPSAATHIRLVQLFCYPASSSGGSYDAPLKCRMFSAPLERPPPFVALSYTWGDNKEERRLDVCAGGDAQGPDSDPSSATSFGHLAINPSLDESLRHIRKAQQSESVTLWVDQICIDQRNTLEKTAQVAAMGTIYGRAAQVLVWLGPSTPGSDDFIDRMATVGSLAREQDVERYFDPAKRTEKQTDDEFWQFMSKVTADSGTNAGTGERYVSEDDKFETFLRRASDALFGNDGSKKKVAVQLRAWQDRPWFTRVWVLQEYSLAAKSPVFLCGDKTIEAELFSLAHTVISMTFAGSRSFALLLQDETKLAADHDGPEHKSSSERMAEQSELMDASLDSRLENLSRLRRHCQSMTTDRQGHGDAYSLGELVQDLYSADRPLMLATDPRDRIFALLNLCTDADGLGISPDYADTQTVDLVYTRAARAILGSAGGMRLLELLRFPKTIVGHEAAAKKLPSWVPDFYHHRKSLCRSAAEVSGNQWLYAPTESTRQAEIIHHRDGNERILSLKGIFVDTISLTGEAWNGAIPAGSVDVNPGLYLQYFTEVEKLCAISASQSRLPSHKQPRNDELAYRVMLGDVAYQPNAQMRRANEDDMDSMRNLRRAAYLVDLAQRVFAAVGRGTADDSAIQELQADPELGPWWSPLLRWAGTGLCGRLIHLCFWLLIRPRLPLQRLGNSIKELLYRRDMGNFRRRLDDMRDKRPFRTQARGLCGIGPRLAQPGDVVVLLLGARTPYVLRPRGDKGLGYFEVLGEAYCHGIMDGAAAGGQLEEIHLV